MTVYAITDTKKGRTGIAPTYLQTTQLHVSPDTFREVSGNFFCLNCMGTTFLPDTSTATSVT